MPPARRCSRTACDRSAVTTLTYVYADQTAVLGPLATYAEPHAYDLSPAARRALHLAVRPGCAAQPVPRSSLRCPPFHHDLLALANAVREAARPLPAATATRATERGSRETMRRGHLRVLTHDDAPQA